MTKYNPDVHHRRSIRLRNYDYSKEGAYFVTICTYNREFLFGEIENGEMKLNEFGNIVKYRWFDLPNHNKGIQLDEFVIMPNHIHGIIIIVGAGSKPALNLTPKPARNERAGCEPNIWAGCEPAPTKLFEIVRQFKTFSAKHINELRKMQGVPVWQRNYYEHIIRNENELNKIREYIVNNPLKWDLDFENPDREKEYKDFTSYLKEKIK